MGDIQFKAGSIGLIAARDNTEAENKLNIPLYCLTLRSTCNRLLYNLHTALRLLVDCTCSRL